MYDTGAMALSPADIASLRRHATRETELHSPHLRAVCFVYADVLLELLDRLQTCEADLPLEDTQPGTPSALKGGQQ
jgi:hypothetical protein